jgi:predicted molibdopterin-dependent oxidoreductase YjgC
VVVRGNLQGALDMGVIPAYLPGYQAIHPGKASRFEKVGYAATPERRGKNALEMISGMEQGDIAALYIMGDDPVGSDPGRAAILRQLEFLVVQDLFLTDTAAIAHVVLPASSFMERPGTITTIERRLRRLNAATAPFAESRPDWAIIQALAERMGVRMDYGSAADIMKEIRMLVPFYADLALDACWPREVSPLCGAHVDLALASTGPAAPETTTASRLLFSSGMMTTRSKELESLTRSAGTR